MIFFYDFMDKKIELINSQLKGLSGETTHVFSFVPKKESFEDLIISSGRLRENVKKMFISKKLLEKQTYYGDNRPTLKLPHFTFDNTYTWSRGLDSFNFGYIYNSFKIGELLQEQEIYVKRKDNLKTEYFENFSKDFQDLGEKNFSLNPNGKNFKSNLKYSLKGSFLILPYFNEKHFEKFWKKDLAAVSEGYLSNKREFSLKDIKKNFILEKDLKKVERYLKDYQDFHGAVFPGENPSSWGDPPLSLKFLRGTMSKNKKRAQVFREKEARESREREIENLEKKLVEEQKRLDGLKKGGALEKGSRGISDSSLHSHGPIGPGYYVGGRRFDRDGMPAED